MEEPEKYYVGHYELEYRSRLLARSIFEHESVQQHIAELAKAVNKFKRQNARLSDKALLNQALRQVGRFHVVGLNRGGVEISKYSTDELTHCVSKKLSELTGLKMNYEINHAVTSVSRTAFGENTLSPPVVDENITAKYPFSNVGPNDLVWFMDDLVDKGHSFRAIKAKYDQQFNLRTAALFVKDAREFHPDAHGEEVSADLWVVFPSEKREHGWSTSETEIKEMFNREVRYASLLKQLMAAA